MKAVVAQSGKAILVDDRPVPELRDDFVLIRTMSVALNPTDWKHLDNKLVNDGCLLGCDFAGEAVKVGRAVTKTLQPGDRVAGVAHGGNAVQAEDGAYAEYIVAKGDMLIKLPNTLDFDRAATLPLGVVTVMQGLYQKGLKMSLPDSPITSGTSVLIYGGATSTGALGIQFAKLSGYTVLTTTSRKNFDYVKSLGADKTFDYRDPNIGRAIRSYSGNTLKLAWDIVSDHTSANVCAEALSSDSNGCRYACFLANRSPRNDVESVGSNMYTAWGEHFTVGDLEYPADEQDFHWATRFMSLTETLLEKGVLRPHKERVGQDGLFGVLQGLDDLRNGRVHGEKLVFRTSETP